MAPLKIQPHGRLQDWVADEKGYFTDAGLDYAFNDFERVLNLVSAEQIAGDAPVADVKFGAFESYTEGKGRKGEGAGDVSCACHWTVNQAVKVEQGVMWGKAYSVADGAILVPGDSDVTHPSHLAGRGVATGYHSGSHYSALQALEPFLPPEQIKLTFGGDPWSRVDLALAGKAEAVNVWGPQRYVLEQQGFRRVADTTFMMAFIFPREIGTDAIEKYMTGLKRAQMDIDLEPERYKHHFLREMPERFQDLADVRCFGVGERVVFLPYSQEMFDATQRWMHARKLFDVGIETGVDYATAVIG